MFRLPSPTAEPWYPGAVGSGFGAAAGGGPVGNKKPAFWAATLAGTTGAGKGEGSGAWALLAGVVKGWRTGPSGGLQAAVPDLGLKKSRSDCSFCRERAASACEQGCGGVQLSRPGPLAP